MSTSRLEKFIYAICSMEVSDLPAPLSRIEILWNCLITGETPDFEPQSRNEQYLMAMLGLYELDQLPTPLSRGEKLLYKIAMGETDLSDIPAYLSRYEELLGYLAENGGVGDFEYILQTLNQRLSTLYSTKERPMKQAVIKGDTLVNELPRPSLKNVMTNVASQKLNRGYDNEKTLVNIHPVNYTISMATNTTFFADDEIVRDSIRPNTKYIIRLYNTHESITQIYFKPCVTQKLSVLSANNKCAIFTTKETLSDSNLSNNKIHFYSNVAITLDDVKNTKILVCEYQDGMENWDIPYFEGTKTFSATPNVVDGEFKQAVVKGQTLVNIKGKITNDLNMHNYPKFDFLISLAKKNTDYLIKYDTTLSSGGVLAIGFLRDANTWSKNLENQPNAGILKLNSGENPNYFRIITSPSNTITLNNLMIIEYQDGMENWDIPYFEGMQSVQLSEVTTTGKNLFDKENVVNGTFMSGSLTIGPNNNNLTLGKDNAIKVEPNTSYTFSFATGWQAGALGLNATKTAYTVDTKWQTNSNGYTFTTDANTNYVTFNIKKSDNSIVQPSDIDNAKLILEKGTVATPYEPYQSNTLTTNEEIVIRSLPNGVCDTFNALTGVYTQRIGDDTFVGASNEEWTSPSIYHAGDAMSFRIKRQTKPAAGTTIPSDIICDKIKIKTPRNAWGNDNYDGEGLSHGTSAGDGIDVRILKSKLSAATIDGFKEWLSENPIRVQYELIEPITKTVTTAITDQDGATQTKLHSFNDGYLSVSSQGLLPSAVDYEVPTNNSYYLPDMLTLGAQYTSRGSADCNATIDGKLLSLGKNRTFTAPSSLTNRLMVLDTPVDDLMFIKGDQTAKDFGYFEGMKSVALSNKMPVLTTTGKNLFDKTRIVKDCYIASTGNVVKQEGDERNATDFISVIPDTTYTLSGIKNSGVTSSNTKFYIAQYNSNKNVIKNQAFSVEDDKATLTVDSNTSYIRTTVRTQDLERFQIEYGTQATVYEPFKTNILTTSEDVVLRGIGDVKDTLDCLTGEVTQRIGEIVLDGSQNLSITQTGENTIRYQYVFNDKSYGLTNVVSDILPTITVFGNDTECISGVNNNSNILFRLSKEKATNVQECKQYLQQNPITVHYERITPTVKTVDLTTIDQDGQPTKLKTFNDITHVEIKVDNMIPSVDVEVATKISETLSTLGLDHHDISETQNKLDQTIEEQTENTDAAMIATTEIYEQTL